MRIKRYSYFCCMLLLHAVLRLTPNFLRRLILRATGAKISANVFISSRVRFDFPWRLKIGKNSFINDSVYLDCRGGGITIGDNCDISAGAKLHTLSHNHTSNDMSVKKGDILISCRVWLCTASIILPDVQIGAGSVVGAHCVISKSLVNNSITKISMQISTDDRQEMRSSNIDRRQF